MDSTMSTSDAKVEATAPVTVAEAGDDAADPAAAPAAAPTAAPTTAEAPTVAAGSAPAAPIVDAPVTAPTVDAPVAAPTVAAPTVDAPAEAPTADAASTAADATSSNTTPPTLMAPTTEHLLSLSTYQRGQLAHIQRFHDAVESSESSPTTVATDVSNGKDIAKKSISLEEARDALVKQVALMQQEEAQALQAVINAKQTKDREDVRKAVLGSPTKRRKIVKGGPHVETALRQPAAIEFPPKQYPQGKPLVKDISKLQEKYTAALNELKKKETELSSLQLQVGSYTKIGNKEVVIRLHRRIENLEPSIQQAKQTVLKLREEIRRSRAVSRPPSSPIEIKERPVEAKKAPVNPPPSPPRHADAKAKLVGNLLESAKEQERVEEARKQMRDAAIKRFEKACDLVKQENDTLDEAERYLLGCFQRGEKTRVAAERVGLAKKAANQAKTQKDEAEVHLRVVLAIQD